MRWARRGTLGAIALAAMATMSAGCGSDDGDEGAAKDAGGDGAGADAAGQDGAASDGDGGGGDGGGSPVNFTNGAYLVGIKLSLAGVQLVAKAEIEVTAHANGGATIDRFELFGANAKGEVEAKSFAKGEGIPVAADGTFTMDLGVVVVPPMMSPTGTEVGTMLVFSGTITAADGMCGKIEGKVPAFQADLAGSTFRVVKWATPLPAAILVACEGSGGTTYQAIATCPTLKAGANTMTSATFERTFELYLPAAVTDTTAKLPVVFLYHGNTGSSASIISETGWDKVAAAAGAILVVPNTAPLVNGSKPVLDWRYGEKAFDMDNRELVYFDDLRSCIGKQFTTDPARLYVTGMSAGGMMSTFLAAHRAEVIAAAAPLSGGYLHDWPDAKRKVPFLVTWGGAKDTAYAQNFDTLAKNLLTALDKAGHVHADCNHETGHKIPPDFVPLMWQWLQAFTLASSADAHAGKLPAGFPAWCKPAASK